MSQYTYRRVQPDDLPDLCALYHATFEEPMSVDTLATKFDTSAFGATYVGYVALHTSGDLAAYYGLYPATLQRGGVRYAGAQSGDTMTHPEHRKQGLFVTLAQHTYALAASLGIETIYGFPNANSLPGFRKHLGWQFLKPMLGGEIRARRGPWRSLERRLFGTGRILERLERIREPVSVEPALEPESAHSVVHDRAYLDYKNKNSGSIVVATDRLRAWLKPGKRLDLGSVQVTSGTCPYDALSELLAYSGAPRLRLAFSDAGAPLDRIRTRMPLHPVAEVGYLTLGHHPGEDLHFCRGDFDYF